MENKRKIILFIAQSLDGYIATKDDSLEWLFKVEGKGDNGFSQFIDPIDTVLMGKKTYKWIMEQNKDEYPYSEKTSYVFLNKKQKNTKDVKFIYQDIVNFTQNLKSEADKDIWMVGGGNLLYTFLRENLIDELIITVAPVILGEGIPLFKVGNYHLDLTLLGTQNFNQFVQLHYKVNK